MILYLITTHTSGKGENYWADNVIRDGIALLDYNTTIFFPLRLANLTTANHELTKLPRPRPIKIRAHHAH